MLTNNDRHSSILANCLLPAFDLVIRYEDRGQQCLTCVHIYNSHNMLTTSSVAFKHRHAINASKHNTTGAKQLPSILN